MHPDIPKAKSPTTGVVLMLVACVIYALTDAGTKLALAHLPLGQVIVVRGLFICLPVLALTIWRGRLADLRWQSFGPQLACGLCHALAAWFFLWSLPLLSLPVAVTAVYTSPLFVVILAPLLLKERLGVVRVSAAVIGFIGIMFVAHPTPSAFNWAIVLPVVSALLAAFRDIFLRRLVRSDSSISVVMFSQLVLMLSGVPFLFLEWSPMDFQDTWFLLAIGIGVGVATFYTIEALRHAEASFVSAFRFSGIIWAGLFGFAIWGNTPDFLELFGMALVGLGGAVALTGDPQGLRSPVQR
jgi:drug/metabolite transporter (DMT)-like permease